jgi:hypothetical protein
MTLTSSLQKHFKHTTLRVFGLSVSYEHLILVCLTLFLVTDILTESGVQESVSKALTATATFLSLVMGVLMVAHAWAAGEPLYEGFVTVLCSSIALALRI